MTSHSSTVSQSAFSSVCEAHIRVCEVQALLEAVSGTGWSASGDVLSGDVLSALTGIKRLVQGIGDQITQIEHNVSDLEEQLAPKPDVLGDMIQELDTVEKSYLIKLIQDAKAQAQGVAA